MLTKKIKRGMFRVQNIKNRKTMFKTDFLKLSFFAQHFNVPEKQLCWGIMIESGEEPSPALLINGTSNFIGILAGKFFSPMNSRGHQILAYPATFIEDEKKPGNFLLEAKIDDEEITVKFNRELIEDIYSRRWFQDSTAKEIFI